MSAYVILIRDRVLDQEELEIYAEKARKARGARPSKPLSFYGEVEVLEGPDVDGVVILEFESMAAARSWYHSPAYQQAKVHRLRGANYRVVLADGIPPG